MTIQCYVDVVDRLMTKLGIAKAVIGGNSMGGGVSWMFALGASRKDRSGVAGRCRRCAGVAVEENPHRLSR